MFGEWVEWNGGNPPEIKGLRCDMKTRGGNIMEWENSYDYWDDWVWSSGCRSDDIIAYRLYKED